MAAGSGPSRRRCPPSRHGDPGTVMQPVAGLVIGVLSRRGEPGFEQAHESGDFGGGGAGSDGQGHQDVAPAAAGSVGDGQATGFGDPGQRLGEVGVDDVLAVAFGVEVQGQDVGAAAQVEQDGGG